MRAKTLNALRRLAYDIQPTCYTCQRRTFTRSTRYTHQQPSPTPAHTPSARRAPSEPTYKPNVEEQELRAGHLKPLGRPIGFEDPPRPGDYSPQDDRTWRQRRADFVNYQRHLEKRKAMQTKLSKGYYKDWAMLRFNQGKTFLANPKVFKAEMSLFMPNIVGKTLVSEEYQDTAAVMDGKISIVSIFTSTWAHDQVRSFIGTNEDQNPDVRMLVDRSAGKVQHIYVNVEDNKMKWWVLWAAQGNIRKSLPQKEWPNYFMANYELPGVVRETLGLVNKTVGYVFLVDEDCRIRWAGSGDARPEEKVALVRGIRRLMDKGVIQPAQTGPKIRVEEEIETQAVSSGA